MLVRVMTRWRVVARDVNGKVIDANVRGFLTKRRAEAWARRERLDIWQPIAGRPLYTLAVERAIR
jgi:hypothetical protein